LPLKELGLETLLGKILGNCSRKQGNEEELGLFRMPEKLG